MNFNDQQTFEILFVLLNFLFVCLISFVGYIGKRIFKSLDEISKTQKEFVTHKYLKENLEKKLERFEEEVDELSFDLKEHMEVERWLYFFLFIFLIASALVLGFGELFIYWQVEALDNV